MNKKQNVAVVEPVGGHGGNEFYDFGLCEFLSRDGVKVFLYTCDETVLDEEGKFSFSVQKFYEGIYGNSNKVVRGLRFIKGSIKSILHAKSNEVEIVHFHIYHFSLLELFNVLIFKLLGINGIATIHDVHSFERFGSKKEDKFSFKTKLILKTCKKLLVHSELAKDSLLQIVKRADKVRYVPHGDTDFIYNKNRLGSKEAKRHINISCDQGFTLLFFGQIKAVKGLDVLLKSMVFVDSRVKLYVVGKCWKQDLDDYLALVTELGLNKRVEFINEYIDNRDVPFYFWAADAICLPYKKIYSSGVVLRAMDYGCPIICSDLEPLKSVVTDGETGLIFQSENPKELAKKVNELSGSYELCNLLSSKAKEFVDEEYSWTKVAEETHGIYKELM